MLLMEVGFHPHALDRIEERGTTILEVVETIRTGEAFAARRGRTGFRREFDYNGIWHGRRFRGKIVDVIAVPECGSWLVITVLVRFVRED